MFRDALDKVENLEQKGKARTGSKTSSTRPSPKKKTQPTVKPSPTRPAREQTRVENEQSKRVARRDKERGKRQDRFDRYLEGIDRRESDVEVHNQRVIETFIARHEEEVDRLRERYEEDLQRMDERFNERMAKLAERHRDRLKRMVERANDGKRIAMAGMGGNGGRKHGKGRGRGRGHGSHKRRG